MLTICSALAAKETNESWDIFFTTYTAFTTADDVLEILIHRFDDEDASGQRRAHIRVK